MASHLHQRVSHSGGRRDGSARSGVHVCQRRRICRGGHRRRARHQSCRASPVVFLFGRQRLPGRSGEVPRRAATMGAPDARPVWSHRTTRAATPLSYADGREHAHCAAAGYQHRARGTAGDGGGPRRDTVAPLQRPRRSAGTPHRSVSEDCAAHATGDRVGNRCHQHR